MVRRAIPAAWLGGAGPAGWSGESDGPVRWSTTATFHGCPAVEWSITSRVLSGAIRAARRQVAYQDVLVVAGAVVGGVGEQPAVGGVASGQLMLDVRLGGQRLRRPS